MQGHTGRMLGCNTINEGKNLVSWGSEGLVIGAEPQQTLDVFLHAEVITSFTRRGDKLLAWPVTDVIWDACLCSVGPGVWHGHLDHACPCGARRWCCRGAFGWRAPDHHVGGGQVDQGDERGAHEESAFSANHTRVYLRKCLRQPPCLLIRAGSGFN